MDSRQYWIGLNMVLGVGKTLFHRLVKALGTPEAVFKANKSQLMTVEGIGEKTAQEILNFQVAEKTERELRLVDKFGARIITLNCDEYPPLLKSIFDPPPVVYCKGKDLRSASIPLAVVGTRKPTSYGRRVVEELCLPLAEKGVTIISGLARGIDTFAHRTALKANGGTTIAVFGCGLAQTYPPENAGLKEQIIERGSIISEFPMTMGPERNNFPARNRIISGLSYGVLVVEAGEKSGALITAQFALEQGREVFATPGPITSPNSKGPNRLIQSGAKLVTEPLSILEELPFEVQTSLIEKASEEKNTATLQLSEKERHIISLIQLEECHIDQLIEISGLSPAQVSATLLQLELKGLVRQVEGNKFISTI